MGEGDNSRQSRGRLEAHVLPARAAACALAAAVAPVVTLVWLSVGASLGVQLLVVGVLAAAAVAFGCFLREFEPLARIAALLDRQNTATSPGAGAEKDRRKRLLANLQALTARLSARKHGPSVDPVTGLPLREDFLSAIADELEARPQARAMLGLIRIANHDQLVAFDAAAAEQARSAVAGRLAAAIKSDRPLAQIDRDCFAIWFGGVEAGAAGAELESVGYILMQELALDGFTVTPDIQLGSALYPIDANEPGNLLNRAFVSLARPQRTSDGAIAFFARPAAQEARARFMLEQNLRQAVRRGELALHYQPIVDLAIGRVSGAEALLRWRSGVAGTASPQQVVNVLEETGLVHEIGLWTLNTACRQLREWRELGLTELKIAVNISAHQLRDPAFPIALKRTLAAHGLEAPQLVLELTETAAMEDAARTQALFADLRDAGFSLAIDDFGSGYSSLAYLRRLPFQKLKIDREFVTHVDERADSRAICKAVIDLTAGLGLAVLAEGVERYEEVETLRSLGCSTFQGYFFAKPLPPADFQQAVMDRDWLARVTSPLHRQRDELRRRLS